MHQKVVGSGLNYKDCNQIENGYKGPGALSHLAEPGQYLGNQSTTEVLIKNVGTFFSP